MTSSVWSCHHKDTLSVSEGRRLPRFFQGQKYGTIWEAPAECSSCQLSHSSLWGWHWWLQCIPVMLMFCLQCFPCGLSLGCSLQCCELTSDCWSEMITCGLGPLWVMVVTLCASSVIRLWIQALFRVCVLLPGYWPVNWFFQIILALTVCSHSGVILDDSSMIQLMNVCCWLGLWSSR